jgi:hypothetical protein
VSRSGFSSPELDVAPPDIEGDQSSRLGTFRAATNDVGIARFEVPGGAYEIASWKFGHELISQTVYIAGDTTIHLELAATPEPEQPYWMWEGLGSGLRPGARCLLHHASRLCAQTPTSTTAGRR